MVTARPEPVEGRVADGGVRWGLDPARLEPPARRPTDVPRPSVLARLLGSDARVVCVIAPMGYGKTKVVGEYALAAARPTVWLTADEGCPDPTVLSRSLAAVLERTCPIPSDLRRELDAAHPRPAVLSAGLASAIRGGPDDILLVIDDVHELADHGLTQVSALIDNAPARARIVLVGTRAIPFVGRLRSTGSVLELGADDLAFDADEAAALLREIAGDDIGDDAAAVLCDRTEGWAAGLYLAGLALGRGGVDLRADAPSIGRDRYIADFFHQALLTRLPEDEVAFLTRTSVLDELSGPLCDAVLQTEGSGALLARLDDEHLFVVPLDPRRERYRYHGLFRACLRAELARRSPQEETALHARASAWYETQGAPDRAVRQAIEGGDVDRVAALALTYGRAMYANGRAGSVRRWIEWLGERSVNATHPEVAVLASWIMIMDGHPADLERWAEGAASWSAAKPLGAYLDGVWHLAKAAMARDGIDAMVEDLDHAAGAIPAGDQWAPTLVTLRGIVHLMRGEPAEADVAFRSAFETAMAVPAPAAGVLTAAQLALTAIRRGDVEEAAARAAASRRLMDEWRLEGYPFSVLPLAASARMALLQGDPERAGRYRTEADAFRDRFNVTFPVMALQSRIELTRVALGLGDLRGAQLYLAEATDIVRQRPGLGVLTEELDDLGREVRDRAATGPLPRPLTPAERRLLPLLPTYLSFAEIAERLFVSPHTVKTQAISLYRKLGVSSRGAAVEEARRLGLLSP